MIFINELTIESFRGINDLYLSHLADINIFVGPNNSGKTSILEAVYLFSSPEDISNVVRISRLREVVFSVIVGSRLNNFESFINLFNKHHPKHSISLSVQMNGKKASILIEGHIEKRIINLDEFLRNIEKKRLMDENGLIDEEVDFFVGNYVYSLDQQKFKSEFAIHKYDRIIPLSHRESLLNMEYLSPIDHLVRNNISSIIKSGNKDEMIDVLKIFDEDIYGIEYLEEENRRAIPYIQHKDLGLMPLSTFGDGLKKVLVLGAAIVRAKNGILLVDEIETAIHVSILKDIFAWFIAACHKYKVQVFATTHSLETIDSLLKCQNSEVVINKDFVSIKKNEAKNINDDIRIITLKKDHLNNKTRARVLTGEEAYESRELFNMELR